MFSYIKQILTDIKGEIDRNTIIVGDFNTPLTSMDISLRQKINKATEILNNTIELDITSKKSRIHISSAHGIFSRIDDILGSKTSLTEFKSIEITSGIFSDHNGMKLEINHRKRNKKKNQLHLNNMLLKNQWVNDETKEKI